MIEHKSRLRTVIDQVLPGLTVAEIARVAEVPYTTVYGIYCGRARPSREMADRLAAAITSIATRAREVSGDEILEPGDSRWTRR